MNEAKNKTLASSLPGFTNKLESVSLRLDTGNTLLYEYKMEMLFNGSKNVLISKNRFSPADISAIVLLSKKPNNKGTGYFSVEFERDKVHSESKLNNADIKFDKTSEVRIHFLQSDKKLFKEIETAFLRLKEIYKSEEKK